MQLTIGISACLVGQEVRYDKSSKTSNFCTKELGRHVKFRPVCPEVAIGLPIPRPTIRQTQRGEEIIVSRPDFTGDVTKDLTEYGQTVAAKSTDLSGFIFTAKSPSCGNQTIYDGTFSGTLVGGMGVTAQALANNGIQVYSELQLEQLRSFF